MNQKIKDHLIAYAVKHHWGTKDDELMDILKEAYPIHTEIVGGHRWYDDEARIVNIDGMLLRYYGYHITGDNSASDMGLDSSLEDVVEVKPVDKIVKVYEPI